MIRLARWPTAVFGTLLLANAIAAQGTQPRTIPELVRGEKIPWSVAVRPSSNAVAIGSCQAVNIDLIDATGKDVPRNLAGQRVGLSDFDWSATGKSGDAAIGVYDTPNNWKVCACQGAVVGTTINVTAQYPARALPERSKMPELAFRASIELPISAARGTTNPKGCDALATTAVASIPAAPRSAPVAEIEPGPPRTDVAQPVLSNPGAFVAKSSGAGTVTLTWNAVPGTSFYQLWGPGIQNTGISVTGTTQTLTSVPAGAAEWTIGSYYLPGPTSTVASAFSKTQLNVPAVATNGHYRVVANGFRVLHETKDDLLSRDGKGDEVYGAFTMFHYDRHTGTLLDRDLRRTQVVGDVWNFPGRIKGGSWSATGGFKAGDAYPAVGDPSSQHGLPSRDTFPFLIWDGQLTNDQDAVIILPTIWEYDGGTTAYDQWFARELADQHTIWSDIGVQEMIAGEKLGVVLPFGELGAPGGASAAAGPSFQTILLQVGGMFGVTPFDRPLGVQNVGGLAVLPRRTVVLTREIIESALQRLASTPATESDALSRSATALDDLRHSVSELGASGGSTASDAPLPNGGMPYGTIEIPLIDGQGSEFQGQYVMYIQVERIP